MSNGVTEECWKWRYEKLERQTKEMLAKKDKKIVQLEEKVNRLEGLLTIRIKDPDKIAFVVEI